MSLADQYQPWPRRVQGEGVAVAAVLGRLPEVLIRGLGIAAGLLVEEVDRKKVRVVLPPGADYSLQPVGGRGQGE